MKQFIVLEKGVICNHQQILRTCIWKHTCYKGVTRVVFLQLFCRIFYDQWSPKYHSFKKICFACIRRLKVMMLGFENDQKDTKPNILIHEHIETWERTCCWHTITTNPSKIIALISDPSWKPISRPMFKACVMKYTKCHRFKNLMSMRNCAWARKGLTMSSPLGNRYPAFSLIRILLL